MEHEEERGRCGQEEAQDQRRSDPCAERCAPFPFRNVALTLTGTPDLTELDLPSTMKTNFPDPADLLNFSLTITPDEGPPNPQDSSFGSNLAPLLRTLLVLGMYKGGAFVFSFAINTNYPHDPPKVKCTQTVRSNMSQDLFRWMLKQDSRYTTPTWIWRATCV
jgi:hypothetical protein